MTYEIKDDQRVQLGDLPIGAEFWYARQRYRVVGDLNYTPVHAYVRSYRPSDNIVTNIPCEHQVERVQPALPTPVPLGSLSTGDMCSRPSGHESVEDEVYVVHAHGVIDETRVRRLRDGSMESWLTSTKVIRLKQAEPLVLEWDFDPHK